MDKRKALAILIQHSYLISDEVKMRFLGNIIDMSEEVVDKIGYLLAMEKKKSLEDSDKTLAELENIANELKALDKKDNA